MLKISICCRLGCGLCCHLTDTWLALYCCCCCSVAVVSLYELSLARSAAAARSARTAAFASWCDLWPLYGINVGAAAHKSSSKRVAVTRYAVNAMS